MNDMDVEVDVEDVSDLDDTLMKGLEVGMEESLGWLVRNGQKKGRSRIRSTDRVWRKKVYHGWTNTDTSVSGEQGSATIRNEADHARIVDEGLAPAGEITGSNPQVQDIIQWVTSELRPNSRGADTDTSSWDPELQALADTYSPGYVLTAFAVKNKIDEKGYPGIDFTGAIETYLNKVGPMIVQRKIEKRMNNALRARGYK